MIGSSRREGMFATVSVATIMNVRRLNAGTIFLPAGQILVQDHRLKPR